MKKYHFSTSQMFMIMAFGVFMFRFKGSMFGKGKPMYNALVPTAYFAGFAQRVEMHCCSADYLMTRFSVL
jgi:hypothetical protein